jgi:hypothetical protein
MTKLFKLEPSGGTLTSVHLLALYDAKENCEVSFQPRRSMAQLIADGYVDIVNGRYALTPKGVDALELWKA